MAHDVGDDAALIRALYWRAVYAVNDGDMETGRRLADEIGAITMNGLDERARMDAAELPLMISGALHGRASDEHVADLRAFLGEAGRSGWAHRQAWTQVNLANSMIVRGNLTEAADLAGHTVDWFRRVQRPEELSWALTALAMALAGTGHSEQAIEAVNGGVGAGAGAGLRGNRRRPACLRDRGVSCRRTTAAVSNTVGVSPSARGRR
jgi:hypothetical protein